MNKFYFGLLITSSFFNIFSEAPGAKKKGPLTKEELEKKKSELIKILPENLENVFPNSDPITGWDNNKFNNKQLKWATLMGSIYDFLEQTGSTDFPEKFKKYVYDGNEQKAERISNPWTDKSTLSADIFNQAKKLNQKLQAFNDLNDSERRINLIKEYLNNFTNRSEIISKNIKSVWVINYGPKIAQDFFLNFINNFLYKIGERIRGQYIKQEQIFIEGVTAKKASEKKSGEEEKRQAPINKLKDEISTFKINILKIKFYLDDPNIYLSNWLNLAAKLSEFYSKNNATPLFNKINSINNSLIQVSQKLFNSKTKSDVVHEAFDKDLKIINDTINIELLNIDKASNKEEIKDISKSLLLLQNQILTQIKNDFTPFLTQFTKTIDLGPEKTKPEQEKKDDQNFDDLRIILLEKQYPKVFQDLSNKLNKIIDKLNRLKERFLIITKDYLERKKGNKDEQLTTEEKNNIYLLFSEIRREIVSLSRDLSKLEFKEDTEEFELKKKFLSLVGAPHNKFGSLGKLLDQILINTGFKGIYEEIGRNAPVTK